MRVSKQFNRWVCVVAGLGLGVVAATPASAAPHTPRNHDIGWTSLLYRLGNEAMPTGAGLQVTQVEPGVADATDPKLVNQTFVNRTGSIGVTAHASSVLNRITGTDGLAPGIATVHGYDTRWLFEFAINRGDATQAPEIETSHVQSHSWVGGGSDELWKRLDGMVQRDNVLISAAVQNNTGSIPSGPNGSYNGLAVGRSDGGSSTGPHWDGTGRSKPDIVGANNYTSGSAPEVAGAAALLIDAAGADTDAKQAQTLKAILMAGASKNNLSRTWTTVNNEPLDRTFGAGLLNINRSHHILTAGQQEASDTSLVSKIGWDYDTIAAGATKRYFIDLNKPTDKLSILATWNRQVDLDPDGGSFLSTDLANVDVSFYHADSNFQLGSLISSSATTNNNVEHIYQQNLAAGRYAIELTSDKAWDFALAWDAPVQAAGYVILGRKFNNGSFEDALNPMTRWNQVFGTATAVTSDVAVQATDGDHYAKLANDGNGGRVQGRVDIFQMDSQTFSHAKASARGNFFEISVDARNALADTGIGNYSIIHLQLIFMDENASVLATPGVPLDGSNALTDDWVTYSGLVEIDPLIDWAKLGIRVGFIKDGSLAGTSYQVLVDNVQINQVPEPMSLILVAGAGLLLISRRR